MKGKFSIETSKTNAFSTTIGREEPPMATDKKREKPLSKSIPKARGPSPEALIAALSSEDDGVRVGARQSLVTMGKAAVPPLAEALGNKDDLMRWEAAKALGEIGAPEAALSLVKALEDESFDVRWLAAIGLIGMNIKGLKPLLHALMEQGDSVFLRQGAHHVIHDLTKGELRRYLSTVLAALENVEPTMSVPQAAYHALEMLEKEKKISNIWKHTF
jgi:HEAT repeat protein